ncbi:uncharacterized protein LOC134261228 [Saccostrea cucullata]|uniref:uncharacterized protein LOC134261228 n=1 Tax=Saccostrea cuccullata TaxID=36930 RepID=UPI002ED1F774
MAMVWAALLMSGIVCTNSQYIYSEENNCCASNAETMVQIRGLLIQQMRIQESVDSLRQMVKRLEGDVTKTHEDVQIVKREYLIPGPCSTSDSCPDGAACKEGVCSCNERYLNYKDVCRKGVVN